MRTAVGTAQFPLQTFLAAFLTTVSTEGRSRGGGIFRRDSRCCWAMLLGARTSCVQRSGVEAAPAPGRLATVGEPCPAHPSPEGGGADAPRQHT